MGVFFYLLCPRPRQLLVIKKSRPSNFLPIHQHKIPRRCLENALCAQIDSAGPVCGHVRSTSSQATWWPLVPLVAKLVGNSRRSARWDSPTEGSHSGDGNAAVHSSSSKSFTRLSDPPSSKSGGEKRSSIGQAKEGVGAVSLRGWRRESILRR